jgi:hypothetical protein
MTPLEFVESDVDRARVSAVQLPEAGCGFAHAREWNNETALSNPVVLKDSLSDQFQLRLGSDEFEVPTSRHQAQG